MNSAPRDERPASGVAAGGPEVTFSITTCRRLAFFLRTMDSFLARCRDTARIARWICVDDGSSAGDLAQMARAYPFLEIHRKPEEERGHAGSIREVWSRCKSELLLHFEDDWLIEEDFSTADLVAELGGDDQLQLLWDPRRYNQEFNPRHPLVSPDAAAVMERYGFVTEPKSEGGWWWPGFSLNPSLLRVRRARELVRAIPNGEHFELELALQLHRARFRVRQRMFALHHLGQPSAYVLNGVPRSYEIGAILGEMAAVCASEPARTIELFSCLEVDALAPHQAVWAFHSLAAALWYVDRRAGRETLREMWQRLHATGRLWSLELAQLLGFYQETWETVLHEAPSPSARVGEAGEPTLPAVPEAITVRTFLRRPDGPPPTDPRATITVAITTCRRRELFERTMRSFLVHCNDLDLVARWLCVDDNSCTADRVAMRRKFPWLELSERDDPDRGHGGSLQRLLDEVRTPYVFLLEDDHEFFVESDYLTRCLRGLSVAPSVGQCLVNRNYAETTDDAALSGGMRFSHQGESFVAHLHDPEHHVVRGRSNAHWPHFSLRPGLNRMAAWRLGFRNEPSFEIEFARRYCAAGFTTIFLDGVYHRHIGKLTSETGNNAYTLNESVQF